MTLEERVARLERSNRRLRTGLAGSALVLVVAVCLGQGNRPGSDAASVPTVIQARSFEVLDETGRAAVRLTTRQDEAAGGVIETLDGSGRVLVQIGPDQAGIGSFVLHNREGGEVARVAGNREGHGAMALSDGLGQTMVLLGTADSGEAAYGAAAFFDKEGVPLDTLPD